MRKARFRVAVGGQDVTAKLLPRLISLSISKSATEVTQSATFDLDDADGAVRFPANGTAVSVELGWSDGPVRRFEGEVDRAEWSLDRDVGSVLTVTARSASLRGKAKQPRDRHWENTTLGAVLRDSAGEADLSITVHGDLAGRQIEYEAQDNESFLAFADRLAREHGATFAIQGKQAAFVPRNQGLSASGAALANVTVRRGINLISASGLTPLQDRPRFRAKKGRWYDIQKAKLVIETVQTDEDVDAEDVLRMLEPDGEAARRRADSDSKDAAREKGAGTIIIDGEPSAEPEGTVTLSGVRPGLDGTYTIDSVTDLLDRQTGYTTQISLGNPKAGADSR